MEEEQSKLDIKHDIVRRIFVMANYMHIYKMTGEDGYTILIPERENEQRTSNPDMSKPNQTS